MTNEEFIQSIALPGEEWRDVVGFEDQYSVSSLGRIAIMPRIVGYGKQGGHQMKGKILSQHPGNNKPYVYLTKNSQPYKRFVNRVVAKSFLADYREFDTIVHINGDENDCRASNLRVFNSLALPESDEEWRDVVGYEGAYKISSNGRVFSLIAKCVGPKVERSCSPHYLKPSIVNRNGKMYYVVNLSSNGRTNHKYLHRLIAESFIPNPENYPEVDHIDRNGLNNSIANLRWCSHRQNQNNPNTKAAFRAAQKTNTPVWNYVPVAQLQCGELIRTYKSVSSVKAYGFSPSAVSNCLRGYSKSHKGYKWEYLSDYESQVSKSKN